MDRIEKLIRNINPVPEDAPSSEFAAESGSMTTLIDEGQAGTPEKILLAPTPIAPRRSRPYRIIGAAIGVAAVSGLVIAGIAFLPAQLNGTSGIAGSTLASKAPAPSTNTPSSVTPPFTRQAPIPGSTVVSTADGKLSFDLPKGYSLQPNISVGAGIPDPYGYKWMLRNPWDSLAGLIGRSSLDPATHNPSATAPPVADPSTGCASSTGQQRKVWVVDSRPADPSLTTLNNKPVFVLFTATADAQQGTTNLGLTMELSAMPRPIGLIPGGCGVPDSFYDSVAKEYVTFSGMPYSFGQQTEDPLSGVHVTTLDEAKEFVKTPEYLLMMQMFQSVRTAD